MCGEDEKEMMMNGEKKNRVERPAPSTLSPVRPVSLFNDMERVCVCGYAGIAWAAPFFFPVIFTTTPFGPTGRSIELSILNDTRSAFPYIYLYKVTRLI